MQKNYEKEMESLGATLTSNYSNEKTKDYQEIIKKISNEAKENVIKLHQIILSSLK